jgi:hypothetical protein
MGSAGRETVEILDFGPSLKLLQTTAALGLLHNMSRTVRPPSPFVE